MLWRIFRSCYARSASCSIACFGSVEAASLFCPLSLWKMLFQILLYYGPIGMKHMRVNVGSLFWLYRPLSTWMDFLLPPLRFNLSTALDAAGYGKRVPYKPAFQSAEKVRSSTGLPSGGDLTIRQSPFAFPGIFFISSCVSSALLAMVFGQVYYAEPPPRFRLCFGNCCGDQLPHVCRPVFRRVLNACWNYLAIQTIWSNLYIF